MKGFKGEIFIKVAEDSKASTSEVAEKIHQQLVGNQDYIDSRIGINRMDNCVLVWFDDIKGEVPELKF